MKAVTPVIALVMLMLITVSIVGISYTWFSRLMSSSTSKSISIPPGGAYCSNGEIKVFLLNNGDKTLTSSDIAVAQVDGNDVKGTPFFGDLGAATAYWKFDEGYGSIAIDSSASINNGNLKPSPCPVNCPLWVAGKAKNALDFDGVNDYVSASQISPSKLTLSAWVRFDSLTGHEEILAQQGIGEGSYFLRKDIAAEGGKFSLFIYDGSTWEPRISSVTTPSQGVWYHVAATYNGSHESIYVNGLLEGTLCRKSVGGLCVLDPISYGAGGNFIVGSSGAFVNPFNGAIDEIKVYTTASSDINLQPGTSGLVISYPGSEGRHSIRIGTSSSIAESAVTCA